MRLNNQLEMLKMLWGVRRDCCKMSSDKQAIYYSIVATFLDFIMSLTTWTKLVLQQFTFPVLSGSKFMFILNSCNK